MNSIKRSEEIDIIKALGIMCVVAGHSSAPIPKMFFLFHMAIFFIASGYFYKEHYSETINGVKNFIVKKLKLLWVPYFLCNSCYILLNNVFIKLNIYTNNPDILSYGFGIYTTVSNYFSFSDMLINIAKSTYFSGCAILASGFWFVKILLSISILYCVLDFVIKKIFKRNNILIQAIISIIFLLTGYCLHINNHPVFELEKLLSYYILYFMGHVLFLCKEKYCFKKDIYYLFTSIISLIILIVLDNFGHISLNLTEYTNPLYFLLVSFFGWCFSYSLSVLLKKCKIKKLLLEIGKRTMSILILHLLCMKLVTYIVCLYYKLPLFCVAGHPNVYGDKGVWWLAYMFIGIFVPVCVSIFYEKIKSNIITHKN